MVSPYIFKRGMPRARWHDTQEFDWLAIFADRIYLGQWTLFSGW